LAILLLNNKHFLEPKRVKQNMISYIQHNHTVVSDGFSQMLRSAQEEFSENYNINIIGQGIEEVIHDQTMFEAYKGKLLQGLTADEAQTLDTLFDGARQSALTSESMASIQPISSMNWPMLRKFWPRVGAIHAIPTEAVKKPTFDLSYQLAYVMDGDRNKIYLPEGFRNGGAANGVGERPELSSDPITIPVMNTDLMAAVGATKAAGDEIDIDFFIIGATVEVTDVAGANPESVVVALSAKMDSLSGMFSANVSAEHSDGTVNTDVVHGSIDRYEGTATMSAVLGKVKSLKIKGHLNTSNSNRVENVGYEINTRRVNIGTGPRLAAPLSTEWLQDLMAMYSVDGFLKVQETMTSFLAQKLDLEADNFLQRILDENKNDPTRTEYSRNFDVRPSASFTGSPKEWREEMKTVVDHLAITMRNESSFTGGKFSMIGNPLDIQLIPNNDWIFNSSTEDRAGVSADYNVGAYSGANSYRTVATPNSRNGKIKILFQPTDPEQMSVKFYPYAYNVEQGNGYRDPNNPNLPSIQISRRHTFEVMTPLVGEIVVKNNDGSLPA
jgi:hypothetical protein